MVTVLVAPGASPADPATVRNPLPHSSSRLTRRKTAFTCSVFSGWSETFFSLKDSAGTTLFLPSTTPASSQPVESTSTWTPFVRSTDGPQPLVNAIERNSRACFMIIPVIGTAEAAPYDGSAPLKRRPTSDRHRRSGALRPQPSVRRAALLGVPVAGPPILT